MKEPAKTPNLGYVQFDVLDEMDNLVEENTIIIGRVQTNRPLNVIAREYATMRHSGYQIRNIVTGTVVLEKVHEGLFPTQRTLPLERK